MDGKKEEDNKALINAQIKHAKWHKPLCDH